jgi:alkylated DNA repair dioxygenase AlkB
MDDQTIDLGGGAWVRYVPRWFATHQELMAEILATIELRHEQWTVRGKPHVTSTQVRSVGRPYLFGGEPLPAVPWTPSLSRLRSSVEDALGEKFNSAYLNFYPTGNAHTGPHRDPKTAPGSAIASVSLGWPRAFVMRHRVTRKRLVWDLGAGDLFAMGGSCQRDWEHSVPKRARAEARLSVTFRRLDEK